MKPALFRVIFNGKITPEGDPAQVQASLAKLFNLEPTIPQDNEKLRRLFSGKTVIVKDQISLEEAEQYRCAIKGAGALCEIKPLSERRKAPRRVLGDRRTLKRTSSIQPDRRQNSGRRNTDLPPEE